MPRTAKIAIGCTLTALIGGAVYLIAVRGPAMLLDMATSVATFICL